ncbi:MAG: cell envelope biogenesis protein OmpA [Deltaproteobacteria bacterium]|jgi:uncharacterized protein YcfJ|nr:cell envelope biogenesis protein OmpA [Deltaproteobacteria bacterium]
MKTKFAVGMLVLTLATGGSGCSNLNKTEQGALSGAARGAIAGAGIAAIVGGYAGWGALTGAGVGALAGGILGNEASKDSQR